MKKKNTASFIIFSAICSVLAAYVANRVAAIALSLPGDVILTSIRHFKMSSLIYKTIPSTLVKTKTH